MNENESPKILFICTAPRSLSTVFSRTFMNHPKTEVFIEYLNEAYFNQIIFQKLERTFDDLFKPFEEEVDNAIKNGKTVIIKEMAHSIPLFLDQIKNLLAKYKNSKVIHLVRHPICMYSSYEVCVNHEKELKRGSTELIEYYSTYEYYGPMWKLYNDFQGKVVIAEDLQEQPDKIFQEAFEYAGLSFTKDVLTYDPLIKLGIPEKLQFWKDWYAECFKSSNLKAGKTDLNACKIMNEKLLKQINEVSIGIYEKFVQERNKQVQL